MTRMTRWVTLALLWAAAPGLSAQDEVRFAGRAWVVDGGEVEAARVDGREALRFRSGRVRLPDAAFGNGTITFDFRTTGHRSFAGIGFRVGESGGDFEYVYLRPHQTGRFDALQYTPVDHGLSAWQIYAEHNGNTWIPTDEWIPVRIVVRDAAMDVFVGESDEPVIRVDHLERSPMRGGLVLVANFPDEDALDLWPTAFADLRVEHGNGDPVAEAGEPVGNGGPTMIQRWDVSAAFPAPAHTLVELPADVVRGEWESIWTHDARGRLNIGRSRALQRGEHGTTVLTRAVIRSDRAQVKKLNFGFSDRGSVFLNGRLLFTGDNTYLSRSERYLGVMTIDNDALYLPLEAGENELIVAVTESFGGWGVVARLEDLDGVEVLRAQP